MTARPHLSIVRGDVPPPPEREKHFDDEWTTRSVRSTLWPVADGQLSGTLTLSSDEGAAAWVELAYRGTDAAGAPLDRDLTFTFDGMPAEAFEGVALLFQRLAELARREGVYAIARPHRPSEQEG